MFGAWTKWLDAWVPPSLADAGPQARSAARTALGINAVVFTAGASYALIYVLLGMPVAAFGAGTAMLVATGLPVWFYRRGDITAAGHLLGLTAAIALVGVTLGTGGLASPANAWFLLAPMIPSMIAGRRAGLWWVAFTLGWFSLLYALHGVGIVVPDQLPNATFVALYDFIVPSGLMLTVFAIAWTYEVAKEDALHRVQTMTTELAAAHDGARQLLDTMQEGLLLVRADGRLEEEHSAAARQFVDRPQAGQPLWELFAPVAPTFASWLELAWEDLEDDWMPIEVVMAQLPGRLELGERHVALTYRPVLEGDELVRVLVSLTDVTAEVVAEAEARSQREVMAVFTRMLRDPHGVTAFFEEADELVRRITEAQGNAAQEARWLHTLKGNCAVFGLTTTATRLHALEDRLADHDGLRPADRDQLHDLWARVLAQVEPVIGQHDDDTIAVDRGALDATIRLAERGTPGPFLAPRLRAWTWRRLDLQLDQLAERAWAVAERLGKDHVSVRVEADDHRVPPTAEWGALFASLVHTVRNAMDHGVEDPHRRRAAGKPEQAEVTLRAERHGGELWIDIVDDGAGVDWDRLQQRATERGLPFSTHRERVEVLLADGVSSRDEVSDMSGRGVGAAAVAEAVKALGGTIEVQSRRGAGTCFRVRVPQAALGDPADEDLAYPNVIPLR